MYDSTSVVAVCGSRVVVVPYGNNPEKNQAVQAFGAELIEHGRDFDEARRFVEEQLSHALTALVEGDSAMGKMVASLLGRAFEGSASSLVSQLLDQSKPTPDELDKIRKAIEEYDSRRTDQ